jgi:GNAT superfamily N-acetyltransferase
MNPLLLSKSAYAYYKKITLAEKIYVCLSQKEFNELFDISIVYIEFEDHEVCGLLMINKDIDKHYITLLYGQDTTKKTLLDNFRRSFPHHDLWVHFLNPKCLAWYPKNNIVHPCLQGAIINSKDYHFYLSNQFQVQSLQETYYLDLAKFNYSNDLIDLKQKHFELDINYSFYHISQYRQLITFFDNLQIPPFKTAVIKDLTKSNPLPLLIATHQQKIIGFAGPLKVEKSKRGYFAGIALLDAYQGQKIGKVLFHELCQELKKMKAQYMTLFTNVENPAKHIYLKAGCEVIQTCASLKRNGV